MQYKTEDTWTECFTLNSDEANIAIPSVAYLGLSAETGELSDNHDIISLKAENLYSVNNKNNAGGSRGDSSRSGRGRSSKAQKQSGSWSWFLFKVVLFFGAIVGGYFGWTIYRTKARSSRF